MKFFTYLTDGSSLPLYLFIIVISTLLASFSQDNKGRFTRRFWFVLSYLFLLLFFVTSPSGTDFPHYMDDYKYSELSYSYITSYNQGFQGIAVLMALLHTVVKDPFIGVCIIRTISLTIIFYSFYLLRNKISLGLAVFIYASLYYFYGFNALKWALSGALCVLSSVYYVLNKKWLSLLFAGVAVTIHATVLAFLGTLLAAIFLGVRKKMDFKRVIIISSVGVAILMVGFVYLQFFLASGVVFAEGRFDYAIEEESSHSGLGLIILYAPIIIIGIIGYKYAKERNIDEHLNSYNLFCVICLLTLALMRLQIGQLSRLEYAFSFPLIIYLPLFIHERYPLFNSKGSQSDRDITYVSIVLFCIFRMMIQLSSILEPAGMEKYNSIIFI